MGTRTAVPQDLEAVAALAGQALAGGGQRTEDLVGAAVRKGLVQVAEVDGRIAGMLAVEAPMAEHLRVWCVAVQEEHRRAGVAGVLLDEMLARAARGIADGRPPTVSAVVGLEDVAASGLLLSRGFVGTRVLRAGAEGRRPQVYFQHKVRVEYVDPDSRCVVPLFPEEQLIDFLAPEDHAVTALVSLAGEPAFEVSRFERDDPATLQSDEAAAGIAFSGAVLAAITFLLGFSFASARFPDDVRLLLIGATFATTLSLIVYAGASGELARIRSNAFGRIMKWGNVLSEYGGVLPFLISLPVTYAEVTGSTWSAVVTGLVLSVVLAAYERSGFSIAHRFRWGPTATVLAVLTSLSPLIGSLVIVTSTASWAWTTALVLALAGRTWLYLFRRGPEAGITEFRRTWQVRK